MAIKIGINGFGRIGRLVFRSAMKQDDVTVVGINDLLDVDHLAYLLKYDSVHGKYDGTIEVKGSNLVVDGQTIKISAERDPAAIGWGALNTDVVAECTGIFTTLEKAQLHIDGGAKKSGYFCSLARCTYVCNGCKSQRSPSKPKYCFQCILYYKLFSSNC